VKKQAGEKQRHKAGLKPVGVKYCAQFLKVKGTWFPPEPGGAHIEGSVPLVPSPKQQKPS